MIPERFGDLTPEWFASIGIATEAVDVEPLAGHGGLLTAVARVRVDGGSLIIKLRSPIDVNAEVVRRFRYDEREVGAYRDLLARHADLPVPPCRHADVGGGRFVVVLDDLGHLASPSQLDGAAPNEALLVVDALSSLHGAFWGSPTLDDAGAWLPSADDPLIRGYGMLFEQTWPFLVAALAPTPEQIRAAESAMGHWDEAISRFTHGPTTLVHGDARLDNVLADDRHAVMIDWQLAAKSNGAYDLAFFAAGSLERDVQRWFHEAGPARYVDMLGTDGYCLDDAIADYRLGHVVNLPNPVTAYVAVEPPDERGRRLLEVNARRALDALVDLGF